jgi:tetratricopeptide (TPR) repeat protein
MHVQFTLRRRETPAAAAALFVARPDVPTLLAVCARLPGPPPAFAVEGGFLVRADRLPPAVPFALPLRRVGGELYVPADADLVPGLHPEEAVALTRDRGLVVLPGSRVLAFDPALPLPRSALVTAPVRRNGDWQPMPEARPLSDRLHRIELRLPPRPAEDILDAGGTGVGTESPRPPAGSFLGKVGGAAALGAGAALAGLSKVFGGGGALGKAAAWLADKATALSPRLSEAILGKQEAALRELLRQFRTGNLEAALRRALPLGGNSDRARGAVHSGSELPFQGLFYSLASLLAGDARGPGSVWYTSPDLHRELEAEYRRAAEAALRRGDFRRAAFIYGRLLGDLRAAADALATGGLHRDAAILYRDRLHDPLRAAAEFEAAGEFDTALALLRKHAEHERAGDLLRRLGDEDAALAEYHAAAMRIIDQRADYLAAGELLWRKTERPELAGHYFGLGWTHRNNPRAAANAVPCAVKLAGFHARADTPAPLFALLGEAEEFLAADGPAPPASQFFNAVARLADLPHLAGVRDDLRDRCRLGLAAKLRQTADRERRAGTAVGDLFGRADLWPAELHRDADFALRARVGRPRGEPRGRPATAVRVYEGTVTAACHAPETGDVVLGFDDGRVVVFRPESGEVVQVNARPLGAVTALATDARGELIVSLKTDGQRPRLRSYRRAHGGHHVHGERLLDAGPHALAPLVLGEAPDWVTVLSHAAAPQTRFYRGLLLLPASSCQLPWGSAETEGALLALPTARGHVLLLSWGGNELLDWRVRLPGPGMDGDPHVHPEWSRRFMFVPQTPPRSTLHRPPFSWLQSGEALLEVAGLNDEGRAFWMRLTGTALKAQTAASMGPFGAAALIAPGRLAVVAQDLTVMWLRAGGSSTMTVESVSPASFVADSPPVASFSSPRTGELFVVLADGTLLRVPVPA